MSLRKSRTPSEAASEVIDIDVTPVMNMFVILIPFLVSMAVFTHLSIIEFSLPSNANNSNPTELNKKPKLKLTAVITKKYIALTQGENMLDSIPLINGKYNFKRLKKSLAVNRESLELKNEMVVAVKDQIKFEHVVHVMDQCKVVGFKKVGLSSAPEEFEKQEQQTEEQGQTTDEQ